MPSSAVAHRRSRTLGPAVLIGRIWAVRKLTMRVLPATQAAGMDCVIAPTVGYVVERTRAVSAHHLVDGVFY